MDKLAALQEKRKKIAGQIEALRTEFKGAGDKWSDDAKRAAWDQANTDYNQTLREIDEVRSVAEIHSRADKIKEREAKRQHQPNPKSRRMPGQDDPAVRRGDKPAAPSEEERGLAMQAWFRTQLDMPVTKRQARAAEKCKLNRSARKLDCRIADTAEHRHYQGAFQDMHPRNAGQWLMRKDNHYEGRALSVSVPSAGGFTVPEMFIVALEINMLAFGGMLQAVDILRTDTGAEMPWPTADDTSNEGEIVGENPPSLNTADPNFAACILRAYKFHSKMIKVSSELSEDGAFNMPLVLGGMIGERIGRALNRKFTLGTGSNQPRGITLDSGLGKTAASATAIADTELIDLEHSVDPAYRAGAKFMLHDNIVAAIRKIKDSQGRFVWSAGLTDNRPDTLLGYPVVINQHMQSSIATATKTILFGQFTKYKVRQVRNIRLRRLVERFADQDQDAFDGFLRADGKLLDSGTTPVKHLLQA